MTSPYSAVPPDLRPKPIGIPDLPPGVKPKARTSIKPPLTLAQQAQAQTALTYKQPGIAALGGLQSSRQLQEQLNQELSQQLGELQAKRPDTYAQLLGNLQTQQQQVVSNKIARDVANFNMGNKSDQTKIAGFNA